MLVIFTVAVGLVVGIIAHLILAGDGYSWFGEIILGIVGATVFGLFVGILSGARQAGLDAILGGAAAPNLGVAVQIAVAAVVGAVVVDGLVVLLTLRATRRGFGQPAR